MEKYDLNVRDKRESQLQERGKEAERFVNNTDFTLLKEQYSWLCDQVECCKALIPEDASYHQSLTSGFQESLDMVEGLINFLDSFKALAVMDFGKDPDTVYTEDEDQ